MSSNVQQAAKLASLLTGLATLILGPAIHAAELTLTVAAIDKPQGQLMVAVLDGERGFRGDEPPALSVLLPARTGTVTFSTDALPSGEYGIRVLHDENGNGEMDANLVGMPTEAWGFSNNAVGSFGPPGWEDVRFSLDEATAVTIDLNH